MQDHPAFRNGRDLVPLSGFSGAMIAILRDASGRPFVRKAAHRPADSAKLRRQAERQQVLTRQMDGVAQLPAIIADHEVDGCYWFDMQFVAARDGVTWLAGSRLAEFDGFVASLEAIVERLATTPVAGLAINPTAAIHNKLVEIEQRTDGQYHGLLNRLERLADALDATLLPTATHGDLTLENILVDPQGRLWLIDTIDSPFDHVWVDLSKLFQDSEGRWFQHRGRSLPLGLCWELRQRLMALATRLDPRYPAFHNLLLALIFARILPYTKNDADRAFVTRRVDVFAAAGEAAMEANRHETDHSMRRSIVALPQYATKMDAA